MRILWKVLKIVQNRNKLIDLFIGNISNAIVHEILEKAIDVENISKKYEKESETSINKAKQYREKINPVNKVLPEKDAKYVKDKIIKNVRNELNLRIKRGYENINFDLIDKFVKKILKDMAIIK